MIAGEKAVVNSWSGLVYDFSTAICSNPIRMAAAESPSICLRLGHVDLRSSQFSHRLRVRMIPPPPPTPRLRVRMTIPPPTPLPPPIVQLLNQPFWTINMVMTVWTSNDNSQRYINSTVNFKRSSKSLAVQTVITEVLTEYRPLINRLNSLKNRLHGYRMANKWFF